MDKDKKQAIIFDMDGVLIASERAKFDFLQDEARKIGLHLKDSLFPKILGQTAKNFLEENNFNNETIHFLLDKFKNEYLENIIEYAPPIKITNDFIKNYKGNKKIAIVSSGYQKVNEKILEAFELIDYVSLMISREQVSQIKPNPEAYLNAAKILGIDPQECIVVEDSSTGVIAANAASMPCYVFLNSYAKKDDFKGLHVAGFIQTLDDFNEIA